MSNSCASLYYRHRFPAEIIAEAVWLYYRFPISFRIVEDQLAYRGIIVTYKTVREWAEKLGRDYVNKSVVVRLVLVTNGIWTQSPCSKKCCYTKAAKRFIRKLLSGKGVTPRVMVFDKLGSFGAANREIRLIACITVNIRV